MLENSIAIVMMMPIIMIITIIPDIVFDTPRFFGILFFIIYIVFVFFLSGFAPFKPCCYARV